MKTSDGERALFDDMIRHHIRSFTLENASEREYHREMYELIKHVLWEFQEEKRNND